MKFGGGGKIPTIVKRAGHSEAFDERKLYGSVYAACASAHYPERKCESTAEEVTEKIKALAGRKKKVQSTEIRGMVREELGKRDKELCFFYEQHLPNLKML